MAKYCSFLILLSFCTPEPENECIFSALGAPCRIKIISNQTDILDSAIAECRRIEKKFSIFDSNSIIEFANAEQKIIDGELAFLINKGKEFSISTGGRYDVTCKPILELWGFYDYNFKVPKKSKIEAVMKDVGFSRIKILNDTIYLNGLEIDLGSMLHGYAADRIADLFKAKDIKAAMIDIGGEIAAYGRNWKIGIQNPRGEGVMKIINLSSAIATSGDYENFFVEKGKRYHHIIDAKTGYPAQKIISTTVIAQDCITADILATALLIVGPEEGRAIAKEYNAKVFWIDENLTIATTEGFYD